MAAAPPQLQNVFERLLRGDERLSHLLHEGATRDDFVQRLVWLSDSFVESLAGLHKETPTPMENQNIQRVVSATHRLFPDDKVGLVIARILACAADAVRWEQRQAGPAEAPAAAAAAHPPQGRGADDSDRDDYKRRRTDRQGSPSESLTANYTQIYNTLVDRNAVHVSDSFLQARVFTRFRDAQLSLPSVARDCDEDTVQKAMGKRAAPTGQFSIAQRENKSETYLMDTHTGSGVLGFNEAKCDLGQFPCSLKASLSNIVVQWEAKTVAEADTKSTRGQVMNFNLRVFQQQPTRRFVYAVVVDPVYVRLCYSVRRGGHYWCNPMKHDHLSVPGILAGLLLGTLEELGYASPTCRVNEAGIALGDYLGEGQQVLAYHCNFKGTDVVVKVYKKDGNEESKTLAFLQRSLPAELRPFVPTKVAQLDGDCMFAGSALADETQSHAGIIVVPVGEQVSEGNLTRMHIKQLVTLVFHAHKLGLVHRDLRDRNFFVQQLLRDRILLNDWGSAQRCGASVRWLGTLATTPDVLLDGFCTDPPTEQYPASFAHDLETLLKAVVLLLNPQVCKPALNDLTLEAATAWKTFWTTIAKSEPMLQNAFALCRAVQTPSLHATAEQVAQAVLSQVQRYRNFQAALCGFVRVWLGEQEASTEAKDAADLLEKLASQPCPSWPANVEHV